MDIVRTITKYLLLPYKIMRRFSFKRAGYLFKYMREEGAEGTLKRFRECIYGTDIYRKQFSVCKVQKIVSLKDCETLVFPRTQDPKVSILIPACNAFAYTYHCLRSICSLKDRTSYEIILADDQSCDLTAEAAQIIKNIKIIRTKENLGFLRNCNHAAEYARGRYLLFLNNDTQVQQGWLDALTDLLDQDETVGLAGSKLLFADLRLQQAGGIIWNDGTACSYGNRQDAAAPEYNYVKDADYVCGASMMIRTGLWRQIGGFDIRYAPAYCEDADLAFEVRKAGYRTLYQPLSEVLHFEGISHGTDIGGGVKKHQRQNSRKLYEKWKSVLARHPAPEEDVFRARERSFGKKTVLFVDNYVPAFDCDAGSKTIYAFIRIFLEKGWCVKFAGANFYQREPYTAMLQQMGVEVLYGEYYRRHFLEWINKHQKDIDYVLLSRPDAAIRYIDHFCDKTCIRTIYYGHDLHFLRCKREYALTGDKKKKEKAQDWYKKELHILRRAQMSYYPSEIEIKAIKKIDAHIPVKTVTPYAYDAPAAVTAQDFGRREGMLFVGSFTHRPNQDAVLWFVNEIYPYIWKKKKLPFYVAGSHMPKAVKELDGKYGTVMKGQLSESSLKKLYAGCRIAAAPLRYGAGVKGKVIEAACYGVPVVTTSIGAEGIREIGQAAVIRDDAAGFAQEILKLYDDLPRLAEMSLAAQELIRRHYSMEAVWETFQEDFC